MTDAELATYLGLSSDEAALIIPNLTPEKRAAFERMADVDTAISLWQAGLAPMPTGVILCGPKHIRGAVR